MRVALVGINSKYIHKNLAVYSLYSYVRDILPDLHVLEFSVNESSDKMYQKINQGEYDVVCFATYVWNKEVVLRLAGDIKTVRPDVRIVLGGPEISRAYERYESIDYLVIGEGEIPFRQLIQDEFKRPGKIYISDEYIDLNKQQFVYEGILDQLENKIVYYEGSRGCPFHCSYCLSGSDNVLRLKSAEKIIDEITILVKQGVKQIKFIDRTFNANVGWAMSIVKSLLNLEEYGCNFHFEVSLDKMNDGLVEILHHSPDKLFQLEIGIQTTNKETLAAIRRTNDLDKIRNRIELLLEKGNIHLHTDLIAGLPYEDLKSFKESFNEIYLLKAQMLQVGFLKVIPNTIMYGEAETFGIRYRNYPPYEILENKWLKSCDLLLIKHVEESVDNFYNKKYFRQTFIYLMREVADSFDFHAYLGEKLYNNDNLMSLNDKYEFLYENIIAFDNSLDSTVIHSLLQLDWLLTSKNKRMPFFLRAQRDGESIVTLPLDVEFKGHDIMKIEKKETKYRLDYKNTWSIFDYPLIVKI